MPTAEQPLCLYASSAITAPKYASTARRRLGLEREAYAVRETACAAPAYGFGWASRKSNTAGPKPNEKAGM